MLAHPLLMDNSAPVPQTKRERYTPMAPKFASTKVNSSLSFVMINGEAYLRIDSRLMLDYRLHLQKLRPHHLQSMNRKPILSPLPHSTIPDSPPLLRLERRWAELQPERLESSSIKRVNLFDWEKRCELR